MSKSAQAFRTIREVADWLDVAAHVLRFWESKFTQIKPVKRAGGRRYYRPADMELVGGIKVLLHDRGMTIRGVQKMITDEGLGAVTALSPPIEVLLDDPDVIDITPEATWEEDAASEAAATDEQQDTDASVGADDQTEDDAAETESEINTLSANDDVDTAAEEVEDDIDDADTNADNDTAEEEDGFGETILEPLPEDAPEATPGDSETDNSATDSEVDAEESVSPPSPVVFDPAEGALGTLVALTQNPNLHHSNHLEALRALHHRMSAPL